MAEYEYIYETVECIDLPLIAKVGAGNVVTESQLGSKLSQFEFEGLIRLIGFARRGSKFALA